MDIEKIISDVLGKLKVDKTLMNEFMKDPVATLEKKLGIDLPDEQVKQVIDGVKAKLGNVAASGLLARLKALFGKK